jgi:hypothetical protein
MRAYRFGLVVLALASVAGCATEAIQAPPAMQGQQVALDAFPTRLTKPPVDVGDIFVYDNPVERREVIAVGDNYIDYQSSPNGFVKTTWSPILPALRWMSANNAGNRSLRKLSGFLHPLAVGNRIVFQDTAIWARPSFSARHTWECEVQDKVQITVAAGTADTWQILCKIDGRERMVVNYSDDIGGTVRMIYAEAGGRRIVRQLTGYAKASSATQN